MRWKTTKEDVKGKAMSIIVEGLSAEAVHVAMGVGIDEVANTTNGLDKLMEAMTAVVFPQSRAEAGKLYKAGNVCKGPASGKSRERRATLFSRRAENENRLVARSFGNKRQSAAHDTYERE